MLHVAILTVCPTPGDVVIAGIYHCVFGTLEESLQRCCSRGLEDASEEGHKSIAFWLDGFASISGY